MLVYGLYAFLCFSGTQVDWWQKCHFIVDCLVLIDKRLKLKYWDIIRILCFRNQSIRTINKWRTSKRSVVCTVTQTRTDEIWFLKLQWQKLSISHKKSQRRNVNKNQKCSHTSPSWEENKDSCRPHPTTHSQSHLEHHAPQHFRQLRMRKTQSPQT